MRLLRLSSGHIVNLEAMTMLQPSSTLELPGVEKQRAALILGPMAVQLSDIDYKIVKDALVRIMEETDGPI